MKRHMLVLPGGIEVTSGAQEINAIKSVTLTQCVNSGTELYVGSTCAAMLEAALITPEGGLSLNAGDEVALYEVDEAGARMLLGKFLLEKPTRPSANTMKLTAYDFVSKLDRDLTSWLAALAGWPYRLDVFAEMVCEVCGVQLAEGEIPGGDFLIQKFSGDGITGRQLMEWAAQAAGRFCRATAEGKIEFAWYSENPDGIEPGGERFYYQGSLSYEDYEVAPIERVRIQLTADDVGVSYPDNEGEANTYAVTGNYLLTTDSADRLLPVAQGIYETLQGLTYTPFKVSVRAELGIRAGDIVPVTDKNGYTFTALVMNRVHTAGKDTLESTGSARRDSAAVLNNTTLKAVAGRVFTVEKSLTGLSMTVSETKTDLQDQISRSSTDIAVLSDSIDAAVARYDEDMSGVSSQLSQLRQTAEGLRLGVERITDNGVDKVTTKTGYTFDAEGLDIHRSGSAIHNTIDHTGMYVRSGAEVMLQANSTGVIATDLTARHYLIVGTRARFEDYETGRTGCFSLI